MDMTTGKDGMSKTYQLLRDKVIFGLDAGGFIVTSLEISENANDLPPKFQINGFINQPIDIGDLPRKERKKYKTWLNRWLDKND